MENRFLILCILAIGLGLTLLTINFKPTYTELDVVIDKNWLLRNEQCGGILYKSNGSIQYKLDEPFKSGERCTWTIHSPNASKITFEVLENGIIQSNTDTLKVGYFLDSDYKTLGNYQEVVLNYSSYNNKVEVPGPVAFVRFYPKRVDGQSVSGLGFSIKFTSVPSAISLPFKYSNFHSSQPYGSISYPWNHKPYLPLERDTFLLAPQAPTTLALKYFDGNCGAQQDYLTIYQRVTDDYNRDALQLLQQFCSSNITSVPYWDIGSTSEILITFHSSISGGNKGFEFIWVPSSPSESH
jgi:hypothetical protein